MRVLVVDEEVPYPLNSGKRIRTFNLLAPLAARHDITFVCRKHAGSDSQSLEPFGIGTIVVDHPIRRKSGPAFYAALVANLFSKYPYSVSSHRSPALMKTIERLHRDIPFDLVHCEWTHYAANLEGLWQIPQIQNAIPKECKIKKCSIIQGKYNHAVILKNYSNTIKTGLEQRDYAILYGSSGCTTMIYKNKKLVFPGDEKECFTKDMKTRDYLLENLSPEEGDVIIISSSDDPFVAEISAKNSALWTLASV